MKVYVLQFMDYYYDLEEEYIIGVFSSIDKAREEKEKYTNKLKSKKKWDEESCVIRIYEHVIDNVCAYPQDNLPL